MQTNRNAGIIIYRESKLPNLLASFSLPKIQDIIQINDGLEDINVFIFDCPVNGDNLDKKKYKVLRELVEKNKVKFLLERFEAKVKSNVTPRKNEIHYSQVMDEIKAIKQLAAVLKLCQEREENLLADTLGFIVKEMDDLKFDLLTEEASNIIVYEAPDFSEKRKGTLHQDYMERKGISIIFTKDIASLISASAVIITDGNLNLQDCEELLVNKAIIGTTGCVQTKGISEVVLWNSELKMNESLSLPIVYNDEILSIIRYNNSKMDIIEFIKKFPYIYFKYA